MRLQQNSGISKATNAALQLARGEFTALVDHDDVLTIDALESMVDQPKSQKIATIEIESSPKRVRISVLDSGSGVNESQRSRLFDAFFTTKTNGLGMGLAISRGIIEDHQGTLNYAPQQGGGSSFIIDLPSAT